MRNVWVILLVALWSAGLSSAQLQWSATRISVQAEYGQNTTTAIFKYENVGTAPVKIIAAEPSCSCLTPKYSDAALGPGESGTITVERPFRGETGRLEGIVKVSTDNASDKHHVLTLVISVPESIAFVPRFLFWRLGEDNATKATVITLARPEDMRMLQVHCSNPDFVTGLIAIDVNRVYRLTVQPKNTRKVMQTALKVNVIVAGQEQSFLVYAAVK